MRLYFDTAYIAKCYLNEPGGLAVRRLARRGHFLEDLTGDAIHLVTALEASLPEIWSNDRHLLGAAEHFGLRGRSVRPALASPSPAPPLRPQALPSA